MALAGLWDRSLLLGFAGARSSRAPLFRRIWATPRPKQLGRHSNYATLGADLEEGDPFEDNSRNGVP
jgi:hypothetical protein